MPYSFVVTAHSDAEPAAVFDALARGATWPSWSPIQAVEIADGGDPQSRQQVGDTRLLRVGRTVNRERIVEMVDDRRFGYENPNPPFRTYRGLVELITAAQGGTDITWSATFEPKLRWTGPFWTWFLTRFMRRMANGLAEYAARQGS
ncbi:SRPBCC family protein [Pseudonocardia cypriaca]|uniref:Polyketide cyclase/dehydrase/lipid transport protein n=1 Tax=Pseudonocardia cypriaca TaxID=882449 RepID=A0A543FVY2_9PSEU|nr:SRPBCC family protein [Pseudonocardia cypriaca]TQM37996.1 polyketide cyclase/dehydrase/lipid transport protein [Pseudonocardia cypriaca]